MICCAAMTIPHWNEAMFWHNVFQTPTQNVGTVLRRLEPVSFSV
jgi:hypothetical protein